MSFLDSIIGKATKAPSAIPVLPGDIYEAAVMELEDDLAPAAVQINSNSIKIGDKIAKTFFTINYPRFLTEGWLSPIVNMDQIFDVTIHMTPISSAEILKQFQRKVAEVESQIITREKQGLVRDPLLDTAYRDLKSFRVTLHVGLLERCEGRLGCI
jgi:hypothetical protein